MFGFGCWATRRSTAALTDSAVRSGPGVPTRGSDRELAEQALAHASGKSRRAVLRPERRAGASARGHGVLGRVPSRLGRCTPNHSSSPYHRRQDARGQSQHRSRQHGTRLPSQREHHVAHRQHPYRTEHGQAGPQKRGRQVDQGLGRGEREEIVRTPTSLRPYSSGASSRLSASRCDRNEAWACRRTRGS